MPTNFEEQKRAALSGLREIADLAEDTGAESLSHALRDDRIPRLEEESFHLVVLGEFNHGKTTFVNALLEADVLPTGVTPTTAVIHRILYGEQPVAVAVGEDGERITLAMDDLGRYEVDGDAQKEGIRHIEVRYPSKLLASGVTLVDTPGVNDMNEARAEITYGYVPRSDAVLFLLDAGQILKESEREFLSSKLLSGAQSKLMFLVNKIDELTPQEREEALAYARSNLADLVEEPRIYPVSAYLATTGERDKSGLDAFVADLQAFLQDERGRVLLDNALAEGLRTAHVLRTSIDVQRRALELEQGELDRRLVMLERDLKGTAETMEQRKREVRESVAGVKALVRSDVEQFADRFAAALPAEIEAADAKDLRRYLTGFLEERIKIFAEGEAQEVARRLEAVAEDAIAFVAEDARAQAERLRAALGPAAPALDLNVNTFAYDASVFAIGAFGITMMVLSNVLVGGALTLAAPVLAYLFRGRVDKQVKQRAIEEAPAVVREACGKMADAFVQRIDEFTDKLLEFMSHANEEMTRSLSEVVQHARTARAEGDQASTQVASKAGVTLARLGAVEQRLQGLKKSLWSNGSGESPR